MSRVKVHVDVVRNGVQNCIDAIQKEREQLLQESIEKLKNSWFSRHFRKDWGEGAFNLHLLRTGRFPEWRLRCSNQLYDCKVLLKMCDISSDGFIYLSEDDAYTVERWRTK